MSRAAVTPCPASSVRASSRTPQAEALATMDAKLQVLVDVLSEPHLFENNEALCAGLRHVAMSIQDDISTLPWESEDDK